jgi:hypothetical protein
MLVHENFHAEIARQRMSEAERIAIRMGFHSAFARAAGAQAVAADRARARSATPPRWLTTLRRRVSRRHGVGAATAECVG